MRGRRRWREPILAVSGLALALAGAGIALAIAERAQRDDGLIAYSLDDPTPVATTAAPTEAPATEAPTETATPQPATPTQTATREATPTRTATREATPTRTATREPTATRTPTTRATPTRTATRTPTPRPTATPRPPTATPSPTPVPPTPTPAGITLQQTSFTFPGAGTPNGGATIGPFCCQGQTLTLTTTSGSTVGYVYWYKWSGQAYNFPRGGGTEGALPDVLVLFNDLEAGDAALSFSAAEAASGGSRAIDLGRWRYTVTFTSGELTTYQGISYVWETSLAATLSIQAR